MSKGIIISGFAGIGKTTVTEKYPNQIVDLESSDYKWIYEDKDTANMLKEVRKGVSHKHQNPAWPQNYVNAIKKYSEKFDVVLIAQHEDIRNLLDKNKVEYVLCFPNSNCKKEYVERYTKRGNQQDFMEMMKNNFEQRIEDLKKCPQKQFVLSSGKFLEDILKDF